MVVMMAITYKTLSSRTRPADFNLVLLVRSGTRSVVAAALADGEEEIIELPVLNHERRFLRVLSSRDESELTVGARRLGRWVLHVGRVEAAVEGSKAKAPGVSVPEEVAVDGVVLIARAGLDAGGSEIFERTAVHCGRSGEANGTVLHAESAHGVVDVVLIADLGDVRCP